MLLAVRVGLQKDLARFAPWWENGAVKKKLVSKPGEFVRAREQRLVSSTPDSVVDDVQQYQFVQKDQPCMIISVLYKKTRGELIELHGFVRAGTTTLGWVALPAKTAHSFWIR